jgi:hypothetical protein
MSDFVVVKGSEDKLPTRNIWIIVIQHGGDTYIHTYFIIFPRKGLFEDNELQISINS